MGAVLVRVVREVLSGARPDVWRLREKAFQKKERETTAGGQLGVTEGRQERGRGQMSPSA